MARNRNQKADAKAKAPEGNTQNVEFAQKRFELLKDDIGIYKTQQAQLKDEELKLLKFISLDQNSNAQAEEMEEECDDEDQGQNQEELDRRLNSIQQQLDLITKVKSKVETELHLDSTNQSGVSEEQRKQTQRKILQEQQGRYKNLVFNMDYQMQTQSNRDNRNRDSVNKWFEIKKSENTTLRIYSYSYTQFYGWIQNLCDSSQSYDNLYVNIQNLQTESDFFRFDDFVQTIKLTNNTFKSVNLAISFDNNLCILAALKIIMSLKSFNILTITSQHTRLQINLEKVSDIVQALFEVIFSHRNLQSLSLQVPKETFGDMIKSFSKVDTKLSQLRVLTQNSDLQNSDTNLVTKYFEFLSSLPQLYHLQQSKTPISGRNCVEAINTLFKKIKSVSLSICSIPYSFQFEFYFVQLLSVSLDFAVEPNVLTEDKLENLLLFLKEAKQLKNLKLNFIEQAAQDRSRKEVLKQAQTIKNSKKQKESEDMEIEENEETTPVQKKEKYLLIDNLSELVNLEDVNVNLPSKQEIYDSAHKFLVRSTSLKTFTLRITQFNLSHNFNQQIDVKNIYESLNNLKKCRKVDIYWNYGQIKYDLPNKDSVLYTLNVNLYSVDNLFTFNPCKFTFDRVNNVKMSLQLNENLENLNTLCQSLSSTKNLNTITLATNPTTELTTLINSKAASLPKLPFFSSLSALSNLEYLSLHIIFDQHILNTITQLIEQSQKIKSFIFKRQSSNQYYLNFTNLFKALSNSKTLQQLYTQLYIENIKVTNESYKDTWENQKQKNYFNPYCELIKNSQSNLEALDLDESDYQENFLKQILQSLIDTSHHRYMKFNHAYENKLNHNESEDLKELINKCSNKGCLVKTYYKFPLQFPTGSSYDYNYY